MLSLQLEVNVPTTEGLSSGRATLKATLIRPRAYAATSSLRNYHHTGVLSGTAASRVFSRQLAS